MPLPERGTDGDAMAEQQRKPLHDGEAQPQPVFLPPPGRLVELLEHVGQVLGPDADAGVGMVTSTFSPRLRQPIRIRPSTVNGPRWRLG